MSGVLVIYWKHDVQLSILSSSSNLIDCKISSNECSFYLSFVYGHPNPTYRNHTREQIERIGLTRRNQAWFILGDFNEILSNKEKIGGRLRSQASFQNFRDLVRNNDLVDLKSIGNRFSWVGQRGSHHVKCCLDRTMANSNWFSEFPSSETEYLDIRESNNRPMVTYIAYEREEPRRIFRYDSRMKEKDGFSSSVARGWRGSGQTQLMDVSLHQRLIRCRNQISQWKRTNRTHAGERINLIRKRLDSAICSSSTSIQEKTKLKEDLNTSYIEEELFWKQKSSIQWLRSGDRSTKYFHGITKAKRNRNVINSIKDKDGMVQRGIQNIAKVAKEYFQNIFSSDNNARQQFDEVIH